MKIKGIKKLNQNNYNNVTISYGNGEYFITVTGGERYPSMKTGKPVISSDSSIEDIVAYFLDNNKISYLSRKDDINLLLISNRVKNLLLYNIPDLSDEIRKKIIEKYNVDRTNFVYNLDDVRVIIFSYKDYSEYRYVFKKPNMEQTNSVSVNSFASEELSRLSISMSNNGLLKEIDEKFLIDYVTYLINNSTKKVTVNLVYSIEHYQKTGVDKYDFQLKVDDKYILVPDKFYKEYFGQLIEEHNTLIEENKKLQLSMFDK